MVDDCHMSRWRAEGLIEWAEEMNRELEWREDSFWREIHSCIISTGGYRKSKDDYSS